MFPRPEHPRLRTYGALAVLSFALAGSGAVASALPGSSAQTPSPRTGLLPDGRQLTPAGARVKLGNLPTGGALTADGRFLWTVSAGFGTNDVRIVDTVRRRVCQVLPVPGASGGIALDSRHRLAYVSGLVNSRWLPSMNGLPGASGNDVLVYRWSHSCGRARLVRVIPLPPPPGAPTLQQFPPLPQRSTTPGSTNSWPEKLAVSPDGTRLLVPLNLADSAAVIDLDRSDRVRYLPMGSGSYPFGAAVLPGGRKGLVTGEGTGTLTMVDLRRGVKLGRIALGARLSHPEGIVVDPDGKRAYVTLTQRDEVAVIDLRRRRVERTIYVGRSAGVGTMPVAAALDPSGHRLFVAESGADEIAVIGLPGRSTPHTRDWKVLGRIPTADQPEALAIAAARGRRPAQLMWIAARGVDVGPNPTGPDPVLAEDPIFWAFNPIPPSVDVFRGDVTYLAALIRGEAGLLALPSGASVRTLSRLATRQLRPVGREPAPAKTPLRAGGPIKHVFFVVRENRSYDQMLGDVKRGDGAPRLLVFDRDVTPNMHALVGRFPLLDNVMANSDASIQGHFWTSAGIVPDYVSRNWVQNYAGRGRPTDFGVYAVTRPPRGFLFDQAERQHISYFNYGEAFDGSFSTIPDRNRSAALLKANKKVEAHSDLGPTLTPRGCYPSDASIGQALDKEEIFDSSLPSGAPAGSYSHVDCFRERFARQVARGRVPRFNYIALTSDHTRGTQPGFPTPSAMVADSDQALGQLVDAISHSSIWRSSAIFVVEDDSQDGADHVDAHRIPALVISPYARRGAVINTRYDLLSVLRSIELIIGMKPLTKNDALAIPMYDAFSPTPVNAAPVRNVPARIDLLERNTPAAPWAQASKRLPLGVPDQIPQQEVDSIIWRSVHGANSTPPPPGPNAGD